MATLIDHAGNQRIVLESECIVGRSPRCNLRIENAMISAVHACVRWTPDGWQVRDLGSRNGTFLNGARIASAEGTVVRRGDKLAFGTLEVVWEMFDDTSPEPMAVGANGEISPLIDGMIAIPSIERPLGTIYLTSDGLWLLECPEQGAKPIRNNESFVLGNDSWRFFCPDLAADTLLVKGRDIRECRLRFAVSRDEEHVTVTVETSDNPLALGSRAHNYLLLTLARRRLTDAQSGLAASSCGWVHQEELARALRTEPEHVNVDVFRIRKRLASYFVNSAQIVERRSGTGQLRLGVSDVQIDRV